MAYTGFVTTLKNVHKHPNADRLQMGECFGNSVIVSLDYTEGQFISLLMASYLSVFVR